MKIALYNLTTTTRWGGVETFVWEVATQMAGRGHHVEIFGGRGSGERRRIPGVRVRLFPYIDRDFLRRVPLLSRQYSLTKLLERLSMLPFASSSLLMGRFDVVHIQKPYDLPAGALSRLCGAKLLFGCHGKDFWPGDKMFVRFTNGSVAASYFNAEQVHTRYGISPTVVYNGVDLRLFAPHDNHDAAVLRKHGLTPSTEVTPALLYAGRLVRWKGVEYLVQALSQIVPANTVLWVAGDGEFRPVLEKMAAEVGVADRVRFLGKLEQAELAALYRNCSMLVATSFVNETFGMALCEAMACGTPVVASDFGGFREVVVEGENGLLTRPQDPADVASKINLLLADPALRARMGEAGRRRVTDIFSWRAVADRLEESYRCLVPSST